MSADSLTEASATELARAIRDRQLSSLEVTEAHLARIEAVNPKLNAVAQLASESARARARELDDGLARGEAAGPLHGVPFTVKDWIEVAGVPCAAGIPERRDAVPTRDATVVSRVRAAGGVFLGKTIDNAASDNRVYGRVHNPYDAERTPGESSSGEAAIIAAGGSPFGLGSDSGGSIRYPAHCCGIAALKPSAGRVPLTGHFPRIDTQTDTRTQIGPMARSVEDVALGLQIIAGPDWHDPSVAPVPLGDWTDVRLRDLRVALFTEFPGAASDAGTAAAVRSAADVLAAEGAIVEEARPPRIEESWDITQVHWGRVRSYAWSEWRPGGEHRLSVDEIERGLFAWGRFRREMLAFMERFDVIVCPAAPGPAQRPEDIDGARPFIFCLPFSLTGQPVAVVRAGAATDGPPIGVQVVARSWRDDVALAAAKQIEDALGGWQPPPI